MSQLQEYVDSQVATISPFKIKSQFIDAEKDVLAPAEEALKNISQKILAYQEEQERLAKEEAARVDTICAKFATNVNRYAARKLAMSEALN